MPEEDMVQQFLWRLSSSKAPAMMESLALQIAQCSVHKSGALLLEGKEGQYWDENLVRSCAAEEPAQQHSSLGTLSSFFSPPMPCFLCVPLAKILGLNKISTPLCCQADRSLHEMSRVTF